MAEAKTQAVGASVGVLLAAAGVTATVGVFEGGEHRSAVGWFTCCAACMIAAFLIPIIVFVALPWINHLAARNPKALSEIALHEIDAVAPIDRAFLKVHPDFLTKNYGKYKTSIEAETASARYLGKWIQVSGIIEDISVPEPTERNRLHVTLSERGKFPKGADLSELLAHQQQTRISLFFYDKGLIDQLIAYNQGDSITAIGRIFSIDGRSVGLTDCELASP